MAVLKLLERELEARLVELVDLLNKPAGEYQPRARRILIELIEAVLRLVGDDEPTHPRAVRQRQQTMELRIDELQELTEAEKRRLR